MADAKRENENLLEKLNAAYEQGKDAGVALAMISAADLLERSAKERVELEARIQNLIEAAHHYQCQYSDEVSRGLEHVQRIEQLEEALEEACRLIESYTGRHEELADIWAVLSDLKKAEEA